MDNKPEQDISGIEQGPKPVERLKVLFDSKESALDAIKEFWETMPHGRDIEDTVKVTGGNWGQELTMGDRTKFLGESRLPGEKGKFAVLFVGNNQHLTREADSWLRSKGFL